MTDLARVQIGANASLTTIGAMSLFARGGGEIKTAVEAEAYGLGTYIGADSVSRIFPYNEIFIGSGAFIHAKGDLGLYAGTDANFVRDNYVMDARSDTFAGSAIPIDDVDSHTLLITENTITVNTGAVLETAGEATLQAERKGLSDLSGYAKAVSWVSSVQDWLNGAAAAQMQEADINQEGHGTIQMNGTVRTGIERHKTLTLTGWSDATGQILGEGIGYTQTGDVTFTSGPEVVQSDLLMQLQQAQEQLNTYGNSNETLKNYYEGEIVRIQGELAADGALSSSGPSRSPGMASIRATRSSITPTAAARSVPWSREAPIMSGRSAATRLPCRQATRAARRRHPLLPNGRRLFAHPQPQWNDSRLRCGRSEGHAGRPVRHHRDDRSRSRPRRAASTFAPTNCRARAASSPRAMRASISRTTRLPLSRSTG